jgi:hypothetical protein
MTPPNERKAAERQRKKKAGLVRVEVWVPREKAEYVKQRVADIVDPEAARKAMVAKMVTMGWPKHVAVGVVANIAAESVGFQKVAGKT